ncbi:Aste57867_1741 [Aphanomyces stellatus]|uniref:Aste57867_1741 protein n=1 Tax=Aphanomyces stellatus TaxID=120398 RepID=A0A485K9E6_9STRA|nr:hypothetical protein As57867_001739 [Aphanomyces stellatus]VFT78951.1 Aste57867_1741 [Aphanomyces stellatus]
MASIKHVNTRTTNDRRRAGECAVDRRDEGATANEATLGGDVDDGRGGSVWRLCMPATAPDHAIHWIHKRESNRTKRVCLRSSLPPVGASVADDNIHRAVHAK